MEISLHTLIALYWVRHLWSYGESPGHGISYDPEGLLSTFPAIASVLIGVIAEEWSQFCERKARKAFVIAIAGVILALLGLLLNPLLPINKRLWTPTFALFTSGVSLFAFAAFYAVLDIKKWRWGTSPALIFGKNAMLAFILSSVITAIGDDIRLQQNDGAMLSLHTWVYKHWFATWLQPIHASLAYAITIVFLNMALLYPLYRQRVFLRI